MRQLAEATRNDRVMNKDISTESQRKSGNWKDSRYGTVAKSVEIFVVL
jgi:hypothetical protein